MEVFMGRIILLILLMFLTLFSLNMCDPFRKITVVNDITAYDTGILKTIGYRRFQDTMKTIPSVDPQNPDFYTVEEVSDFIPRVTGGAEVVEYYNAYGPDFPAYEFLTLLSVKYNETEFDAEIERISSLKFTSDVHLTYDTVNFNYPAIVAALDYYCSSEYILIDRENLTLHYIYAQLVAIKDWNINKDYLPHGYYGEGDVSTEATGQPLG